MSVLILMNIWMALFELLDHLAMILFCTCKCLDGKGILQVFFWNTRTGNERMTVKFQDISLQYLDRVNDSWHPIISYYWKFDLGKCGGTCRACHSYRNTQAAISCWCMFYESTMSIKYYYHTWIFGYSKINSKEVFFWFQILCFKWVFFHSR